MPFDGTQLDPVTRLLIEGRDNIERGWCQRAFCKGEAVCMTGALGMRPNTITSLQTAAAKRLARHIPHGPQILSYWNDSRWRTKEEVLAVFDRAIAAGDA